MSFSSNMKAFVYWEGGAASAEDAQGTPTQSHILPSILVCEDKMSVSIETPGVVPARWSTTLSSKINLLRAVHVRVLRAAYLITYDADFGWKELRVDRMVRWLDDIRRINSDRRRVRYLLLRLRVLTRPRK